MRVLVTGDAGFIGSALVRNDDHALLTCGTSTRNVSQRLLAPAALPVADDPVEGVLWLR